jgi:hypothetical protein
MLEISKEIRHLAYSAVSPISPYSQGLSVSVHQRHSALTFGHRFCPETSLGRTALAISTLATLAKPARSTTLICMPSGDNGDRRFAPLSPVRLRRITGKSFVLPFVPRVGSKVVTMVIRGRVNTYGSSLPTYLAPRFSAHARVSPLSPPMVQRGRLRLLGARMGLTEQPASRTTSRSTPLNALALR